MTRSAVTLVFIICFVQVYPQSSVRLVDGNNEYEGRVEVFRDGIWGTVCDDGWDFTAAKVVCKEVGYGQASFNLFNTYAGEASQHILLHNVQCTGQETRLSDCPAEEGSGNCNHNEDIGVRCSPVNNFDVRLVDGVYQNVGRLEVYYNGTWGRVCDRHWNDDSADVVCRQLGYAKADQWVHSYTVEEGSNPLHFEYFSCTGSESNLQECTNMIRDVNNDCDSTVKIQCTHESGLYYAQGEARLIGDEMKETNTGGILEVYLFGEWRTVCSRGWNKDEGKVVCKQLGYEGAVDHTGDPDNYDKSSVILLTVHGYAIDCTGKESTLEDCVFYSNKLNIGCTHEDDVAPTCGPVGLNGGAIAGIVIGSLFGSFLFYHICLKPTCEKHKAAKAKRTRATSQSPRATSETSATNATSEPVTSSIDIELDLAVPSATPSSEPPSYEVAVKDPAAFKDT